MIQCGSNILDQTMQLRRTFVSCCWVVNVLHLAMWELNQFRTVGSSVISKLNFSRGSLGITIKTAASEAILEVKS